MSDVLIGLQEARERGLLLHATKETPYYNYSFYVRSEDEIKYNISQNISKNPTGGEYFSPLFRTDWNANGNPFQLENLDREDVWLDAGGHIGLFATRLLTQFPRIKKVISYEPFHANCEFAQLNLTENRVAEKCEIREQALVTGDQDAVDFFLAFDSGKHSMLDIKGRHKISVPATNFNEAIKEATCLKMDIEGLEYDLIKSVQDWSKVRIALIEYHFHYRPLSKNREDKFQEILEIFRNNFDDVYVKPGVENTKTWITHFAAVKRG
jgi:FkbM family methyltransferase